MCQCAVAIFTIKNKGKKVHTWVVKSKRAVAPLPVVAAGVLPVWGLSCISCLYRHV